MLLKNIIVCVVKTIQFLCSFLQYSCTPEDATKISMSVSGASDGSGSGLAKYLFFVDNNSNNAIQVNADSTGKKTYSYTTTTGYHTCHVSAVDKAGNVSSTKSFAEGRTKLYFYSTYEQKSVYTVSWNDLSGLDRAFLTTDSSDIYYSRRYDNVEFENEWWGVSVCACLIYDFPAKCAYTGMYLYASRKIEQYGWYRDDIRE